ncbi:MAG: UpxY family transcription antiterminator [Pirellulales bacterium]|nr:UpxY family transcription antiterminator [Pirellulales bacterium]
MFPENLLDEPGENPAFEPGERHWWVVYTKSRQEKSLARELLKYQIPFYLPQIKNTAIVKGRRRTSFMPLFTGYVFMLADEAERVRGLTTNRISRILSVDDAEQLTSDLRQIKRLIESNAPLTIERRIAPGQRVRIKQGALMGMEGTVLVRRGETRLLVCVNFLQQGASIEVQDYLLERLD